MISQHLTVNPDRPNPTTFPNLSHKSVSQQQATPSSHHRHSPVPQHSTLRERTDTNSSRVGETEQSRSVGIDTASKEFVPEDRIQTTGNVAIQSMQNSLEQGNHKRDVWNSIAQIIKEGPSLPKVELMKFEGDPLEYVEFMTNFKDNIESQVKDESQRFTRLLAQCTGKARDAIRSCVNLDANQRYKEAMKVLLDNFGQPHMIVEAHTKKLRELHIKKSDATALMGFVRQLEDSERALKRMGTSYSNRLDNEDVIVMLMKKLPEDSLKRKWADKAGDIIKNKGLVTFNDFVSFVKRIAGRLNNRYGRELKLANESTKSQMYKSGSDRARGIYAGATQNRVEDERKTPKLRKCPQCSGPHGIWRCQAFKSAELEDRLKTVKEHKLCNICLDEGHFARFCRSGFTCRVSGCGMNHHYLIHREQSPTKDDLMGKDDYNKLEEQIPSKNDEVTRGNTSEGEQKLINAHLSASVLERPPHELINVNAVRASRPRVCFKVVPVRVSAPTSQKEFITYAFLDSGSDATLCLESLVQELSIDDAKPVKYTMTTVNREQEKVGYEVHLNIGSISGSEKFVLENVLTTDNLPVTPKHVAENDDGKVSVSFTRSEYDVLDRKMERMFNAEFDDIKDLEESMSIEDRIAKQIMVETTTLKDGHYQIGLPFKHDPPHLPDSLPTARKRLEYLKSKMVKDPVFHERYSTVMKKYEEEGAARAVPDEELATLKPLWYLPHHAV